jgi:hypothetical protein
VVKSKKSNPFTHYREYITTLQANHLLVKARLTRYSFDSPDFITGRTINMLAALSAIPANGAPRARAACDSRTPNHHTTETGDAPWLL